MQKLLFKLFLLSLIFNSTALSQSESERWFLMPDGLGFSNQLEYSYNTENKIEIFENWMNLDYTKGIFDAGIRFEVFQPNDPDPSISRGKVRYSDIAYKYAGIGLGDVETGIKITVGNYYSLFGRGLIIKSYEDRNIRVDNNLSGAKVEGNYLGLKLTALSGSAANSENIRADVLHALDLEYRNLDFLKIGASLASNLPESEELARTTLASLRVQPSIWNFDIYAEYGIKQNKDIQKQVFNDSESMVGEAFYGNLNFYYESFSFSGEYKFYDNYAFTSTDGTIFYNTPPSLKKEYTYVLLNRHPSPLNQSNEQGFQVEGIYNFGLETTITANFGITKTLPKSSFFQRVNNLSVDVQTQLKEFYTQLLHNWSDELNTILAFGYNEELATNTKNITPVLEAKYYFGDVNTIKLVLEHQQTTNRTTDEKYYSDVVTLEYLRSPTFSVSVVTEMETKEPEPDNVVRRIWSFIQFGYKLGNHSDLSLLIGTRQAGNICVGGVCRFEPAFQGVEVKLLTRL